MLHHNQIAELNSANSSHSSLIQYPCGCAFIKEEQVSICQESHNVQVQIEMFNLTSSKQLERISSKEA